MHPTLAAEPTRPAPRPMAAQPLRRRLAAGLLAATLLAGCGGGVSIGIGFDLTPSDDPPQVSLAVSRTQAFQGDTIDLNASAGDDYGVDEVQFWRTDANGNVERTPFAVVRQPPYRVTTVMPGTFTTGVNYLARAVDDTGQVSRPDVWVFVRALP